MTAAARSRIVSALRAAAPLALVAGAAALLLRFPPAQYGFYPQCPIDRYLHLQCPGCGTTRAIAALLHGDFMEALRWNALTTLLLAPAAFYAVRCYQRFLQRKPMALPKLGSPVVYSAVALAMLFAVVRNLGHI